MKRLLITCAAAMVVSGCSDLTPEQEQSRQQGRPFLIAQSDGLKAYRWDIPRDGAAKTLYFVSGSITESCNSEGENCETVDASGIRNSPISEAAFQAMSKLTPEERIALGMTQ